MINIQSPREKLIMNFKNISGYNYQKMFLNDLSADLLNLKLKCYVSSILLLINDELKIVINENSINVFNGLTLINTYTRENINNINNENQLALLLFIEWGNLLNLIGKSKNEQLMLVL